MNWVSKIGNLMPLSSELNSSIGHSDFSKKINEFGNSELKIVKEFYLKYKERRVWTKEDAEARTSELAELTNNPLASKELLTKHKIITI